MKAHLFLLLGLVSCAVGSQEIVLVPDAGEDTGPPHIFHSTDAGTALETSCGVVDTGNGNSVDYGACPEGSVCGGNGQPNVCSSACVPKSNPAACNNYLDIYGYSTDELLEYSSECKTDPPIDSASCFIWQCVPDTYGDCSSEPDQVYCCLVQFQGEGADGGNQQW